MQGWTAVDTVVTVAYIGGIVTFGSLFMRGQKDVGDFFLGGRSFKWLPIALSVIATDLSAISYMGAPAFAFQKDLRYALTIFILPVAVAIAVAVVVRLFYQLKVFTVYEYLEQRYDVRIRALAAVLFILTRGGWLATAIYVPSLALSVVTGMSLPLCILATGLFATLYASLGGIKAVIWCDVVQFCVLVGGIALSLAFILWDFGGDVAGIWHIAAEQGRTAMFSFDWRLNAPFSVWGIIAMSLVVNLSSYGVDQVVVQRYLTARSLRDVVKSAVGQSVLVVPVTVSLYLVGTSLVAYYARRPAMMESLLALNPANPTEAMDRVFPHFIAFGLPAGLSGLVIAGIMAATMSSVDSGVNSLSTVAVMDFYRRFLHRPWKDDGHYLRAGRVGTVCFGVMATFAAYHVGQLGSILEIMGKINGFLVGPIVAMFFLGVLSKRANALGVFLGTLIGLGAVVAAAASGTVFWLWYGPVGLVVSGSTGYALSLAYGALKRNAA